MCNAKRYHTLLFTLSNEVQWHTQTVAIATCSDSLGKMMAVVQCEQRQLLCKEAQSSGKWHMWVALQVKSLTVTC